MFTGSLGGKALFNHSSQVTANRAGVPRGEGGEVASSVVLGGGGKLIRVLF